MNQNNKMLDPMQGRANNLNALLNSAKKEIEKALPKHVTPDRMLRIALTEARKTPKLLSCDPASFLGAVIQASQLGLEPGGALGHCYLIPYGNQVNFQVGYRGMIDLAMRSQKVSHISARAVHVNDTFEWEFGLDETLKHKPSHKQGTLTHVYCVVHLKDGTKMFDVMNMEEVEAIRKSSKAGNSGPWVTHFEEMAKKTVIRRLFKYMPLSIELQKAVGFDELHDAGESQNNGAIINAESRHVADSGASELSGMLDEGFADAGSFDSFGTEKEANVIVEKVVK